MKIIKRIIICLVTAACLLSGLQIETKAEENLDINENKEIEVTFDISTTGKLGSFKFDYNDQWFTKNAEIYNHDLCRLSLGMAISAFRPNLDPHGIEDPATNVHAFFDKCSFQNQRTDDYDKQPSLYTVSTVMAYKELSDDDGDFTLIAIAVCGGGYKNEWLSNFTCGDEDIHVGFLSAAKLVYDRLFGYVARNNLHGRRLKVWVSGFSRAAAVSNIVAKLLVDSDVFDTSSVYAYTFATPRTTKVAMEDEYKNIFNICGKMDPVPNLAFANWGYDRYGITLYTPAQQTDSTYYIQVKKANAIHRDNFGIDFFNNVEWDTRLRLILNYILAIVPTSAIYSERLQDKIIALWSDQRISNIMTCLMDIASDKVLINDENQSEANSLLTYVTYTILGYLFKSSINSKYTKSDATLLGNLAREHTPEVYLSWLFSSDKPANIYTENMHYLRLVINGDVDIALINMNPDEWGLIKFLKADGTVEETFEFSGSVYTKDERGFTPDIFMERTKGETIILLPKDNDYSVYLKSNKDQTVQLHTLPLMVGYTNSKITKVYYGDMKAGDYEVVFSGNDNDLYVTNYFNVSVGDSFEAMDVTKGTSSEFAVALENANILNLSWRQIIILAYCLLIFVILLLIYGITVGIQKHRFKGKVKEGSLPATAKFNKRNYVLLFIATFLFCFQELLYWLMPEFMTSRSALKLAIGVILLYIGYQGYRKQPSALSKFIIISMILFTAADIAINYSFIVGIIIYGVGEGALSYQFIKYDKPEKWQIIMWVLLSVVAFLVVYLTKNMSFNMRVYIFLYSLILGGMLITSFTMPKKIRFGSIILLVANVLLFTNEIARPRLMIHVIALALYYITVSLFAFSTRYHDFPRNMNKKPIENPEPVPVPAE